MTNRLLHLINRLRGIFLSMEEREKEVRGNETKILALNLEIKNLKEDQDDAMKALDDLETVIKKWE